MRSDEVNARWRQFATDMLAFIVSVAGLALLAGAVLVANAVALAVLERRRELGVWKALGCTAQELLGMIALEYGLLGLTAGLLGMVSVATAARVLRLVDATVHIAVQPLLAALLIVTAVVLALGSTLLVAWRPSQMRPLEVLRNE